MIGNVFGMAGKELHEASEIQKRTSELTEKQVGNLEKAGNLDTSLERKAGKPEHLAREINENEASILTTDKVDAWDRIEKAPEYGETDQRNIPDVKGFDGVNSGMKNEEARTFLRNEFPPEHVDSSRIGNIEFDNEFRYGTTTDGRLGICEGNWSKLGDEPSEITVHKQHESLQNRILDDKRTIAHEVGHEQYYQMDQGMQREWNDMHDADMGREVSPGVNRPVVSDYATNKPSDDFAESYKYYMLDPERLQACSPERYDFMKNNVFKGREYPKWEA